MGFLNGIPRGSHVYVDSCILIYSVESTPPFWPALREFWTDAEKGDLNLCVSELALAEVLVAPLKLGMASLTEAYEELLSNSVTCIQVTDSILRDAARLRASVGLKTPDAIHASTALAFGCAAFLTNDKSFTLIPGFPVILLGDLIRA